MNFCPGGPKIQGVWLAAGPPPPWRSRWIYTRLPQVPQVDAGESGPHDSRPAAAPAKSIFENYLQYTVLLLVSSRYF